MNISGGTVDCSGAGKIVYGYAGQSGSGTISGGAVSCTNLVVGQDGDGTLTISGGNLLLKRVLTFS